MSASRLRLGFVVQRYGPEIAGGAEAHARSLAETLAVDHDVSVLTTCAKDYVTWGNHYPAGTTLENGVRVTRARVRRMRSPKIFAELSERVFLEQHTREDELDWARENGPDSPGLLAEIESRTDCDALIFYSWRYTQCLFGLPPVARRAVLVPTAEEEPAIELDLAAELFHRPAGFLFLTPEEQQLVESRAERGGGRSGLGKVIGGGVSIPAGHESIAVRERFGLDQPYLLYLGRLDRNKGVDRLLRYHEWLCQEWPDAPLLVLVGQDALGVAAHPRRRALGFVSEAEKYALLRHSELLLMPSRYESLSLVVLEALALGCPVLADGSCAPVRGLLSRSGGGLVYSGAVEFGLALRRLMADLPLRSRMGECGRAFAARECDWKVVSRQAIELISAVAASAASTATPATGLAQSARDSRRTP